jgi:biopolymer transport protein ExbB
MKLRSKREWIYVVLFGAMMVVGGMALAATGDVGVAGLTSTETAADGAAAAGLTWQETIEYGGWLMYVLAGLSLLALSLVIYFLAVLRVGQIAPRSLQRELVDKLRAGNIEDARRTCEYRRGPLSSVTLAGIGYMRNVGDLDPVLLKDVMEGEGSRQAESIQGQTQYLMDVAAVAPMVGLLGTVFGMLKAFGGVAREIASAQPAILAAGVSQALITTAFGLMVGIPAMMFYAVFRRKASKLVAHLESASADVLTALLGGQRGRPAAAQARPASGQPHPTPAHPRPAPAHPRPAPVPAHPDPEQTQPAPMRTRTIPAKTFGDVQ